MLVYSYAIRSLPVYSPSSAVFEVLSAYYILPLSCVEVHPYVLAQLNDTDNEGLLKKNEIKHFTANFNTLLPPISTTMKTAQENTHNKK